MFQAVVGDLHQVFRSGRTKTFEWRHQQLMQFLKLLDENKNEICDALKQDLHKHSVEAQLAEYNMCRNELVYMINNLKEWMKPEWKTKDILTMMDNVYTHREPLGVVLVMGAWNYPIQLTFMPMIAAVAAGNCVILKPSELAEHSAHWTAETIPKYVDTDCIRVINGGVPETTELLKERFDHIFYTGSSVVGKIVMAAAAKYLTPVTLELGGKSPCYIDKGCNLKTVARRITWGKFINAGQTCVAPDYVMCTAEIQDVLIDEMKKVLVEYYTDHPEKSESYGRIINARHFKRLKRLIPEGNVEIGGNCIEEERFIAPTVIKSCSLDAPCMQEEIFGPVLPVIVVKDETEAIRHINNGEKPLAMYLFSKDKRVVDMFINSTSSGGVCINDVIMQLSSLHLPFGGVGHSGMGAYHGKASFDTFCHKRSIMHKGLGMEVFNNAVRYPPYKEKTMGFVNMLVKKKVRRTGAFTFVPFLVIGAIVAVYLKWHTSSQSRQ